MITIYGSSDDNVEIEGHPSGDEVGCFEQDVVITIVDLERSRGAVVTMSYVLPGVWQAAIRQLDEGKALCPCTVSHHERHGGGIGYSVVVTVDAGASAVLTWTKENHRGR